MKKFLENTKKFLSKLPVMIVLLSITALFTGLYIGLLARPVARNWAYSYSTEKQLGTDTPEDTSDDVKAAVDVSIVANDSKTATLTYTVKSSIDYLSQAVTASMQCWYIRDGSSILVIGTKADTPEEDYNAVVEEYRSLSEEEKATYIENNSLIKLDVNAFKMTDIPTDMITSEHSIFNFLDEKITLKCSGTVVYTVLMGIALAISVALSTVSVIFFVKNKKPTKAVAE